MEKESVFALTHDFVPFVLLPVPGWWLLESQFRGRRRGLAVSLV